jgi:hypothetical protein
MEKWLKGVAVEDEWCLVFGEIGVTWNCKGNPKNHQIFCKHCVALALFVTKKDLKF